MALDSQAVFRELCLDRGLGQYLPRFVERGWATLGEFGFASDYTPAMPGGEELFNSSIAVPILGEDGATHRDKPKVRRLFFEAFAMAGAELRRKV